MKTTIKSNLSTAVNQLDLNDMQNVQAGKLNKSEFCVGFGATAIVYEAGVLANIWNPIGWGGQVILLGASAYCLTS